MAERNAGQDRRGRWAGTGGVEGYYGESGGS